MSRVSPTLEGFRAAFRRPSVTFGEIAWRCVVGGTGVILFAFGLFEYFDSLPVTGADAVLLRTRQPLLIGQGIAGILRGSLPRAVIASLMGALALTTIWIIAASVGRLATVRALLDYFRRDVASNGSKELLKRQSPLLALIDLNFLRAAVTLGALVAIVGAAILAGFVSPAAKPQPGVAFMLFMPLAGLILFVWWVLNWLLSLGGIFVVRDNVNALGAVSAAITLCQERPAAIAAVSTWTGLVHFAVFFGASIAASVSLGLMRVIAARLAIAGILLVTLAYFAVADWLYTARLAGYVYIAEMPEESREPAWPSAGQTPPAIQTSIDRDEPILSDVPNLIVET